MSLLVVRDLARGFGGVRAVDGVSFELAAGEMLALIGPNGAGKSTCFNLLSGQLRADRGSIRLQDRELIGMRARQIWASGVGRTFQVAATFASLSVLENVQMALLSAAGGVYRYWRAARTQYRGRAIELLEMVGMADAGGRSAGELAYGDVKRLELALALAHEPRLLLMDEPTAGMGVAERAALMELVRRLVSERLIGALFTEHSMDAVFGYADRILVMARGQLIAAGDPDTIRSDPRVQEVYLGAGRARRAPTAVPP